MLVPAADPLRLLRQAQAVEAASDRVRGERWGPRTLDVDLLDVGGIMFDSPSLTLPHPRAARARLRTGCRGSTWPPKRSFPVQGRVADLLQRVGRDGVERTAHVLRL